jgi:surface polysaccharide O-acyltransferase-like enzyme
MIENRINFIEWMKAVAMLVVVYGHTSGHAILNPTLPANVKQIGVVFFVMVTGYLLANEGRHWPKVLYNRLFEILFFGALFTVVVSIVSFILIGDLNESNYLPFMLGLNVIFNSFPANPSLWYIGTYIHLLIVWALLLRHIRVQAWMIVVVIPVEIVVRALLMHSAGDFVAYQLITNWMSVLLLGMYLGQQAEGDKHDASKMSLILYSAALAIAILMWMWITRMLGVTESNPFGRLQVGNETVKQLSSAASVSLVYLIWGILGFQIFRRLRAGPVIQFFSRNSLLIFIIHMPLIYASRDWLNEFLGADSQGFLRLAVNMLIFFVGLGLLSEVIRRLINPLTIRNALENKFLAIYSRRKT